jgi:hypothetical protein
VIFIFNALVNFLIVTVEGVTVPRSIFDKCGCVIPARSASCSWVRLAALRAALILSIIFDKVFVNVNLLLNDVMQMVQLVFQLRDPFYKVGD